MPAERLSMRRLREILRLKAKGRFGRENLMVSNSAKNPHRLRQARVFARRFDGDLAPMAEASHFIGHLARIERFRVYAAHDIVEAVGTAIRKVWS